MGKLGQRFNWHHFRHPTSTLIPKISCTIWAAYVAIAVLAKRWQIEQKFVMIGNRKSWVGFRLALPNFSSPPKFGIPKTPLNYGETVAYTATLCINRRWEVIGDLSIAATSPTNSSLTCYHVVHKVVTGHDAGQNVVVAWHI